MEKHLRVGVITAPHGVRGEVKVFPTTDDAARFLELDKVFLDTEKGLTPLEIERVKFFKQMAILKFKGYDTRDDVQALKNKNLLVTRESAVPLAPDEYYIADLIGLSVSDEAGSMLGTLCDVLKTGANDVYIVKRPDGRELLLPAIGECILGVDIEAGTMRVHVLDGLLDL